MLEVLAGPRAALLHLHFPVNILRLKFYFLPHAGGSPLVSLVQSELREVQARENSSHYFKL